MSDIWCGVNNNGVIDLTPGMTLIAGREELIQAITRRLTTSPGDPLDGDDGLINEPDYGFNVRAQLGRRMRPEDAASLARRIDREIEKDERVRRSTTTVTYDRVTRSITLKTSIIDGAGPFDLTLDISDVTVEILRA